MEIETAQKNLRSCALGLITRIRRKLCIFASSQPGKHAATQCHSVITSQLRIFTTLQMEEFLQSHIGGAPPVGIRGQSCNFATSQPGKYAASQCRSPMIAQLRIFATLLQEEPPQLRIGPYHKDPSTALQLREFASWQARNYAMSHSHNPATSDLRNLANGRIPAIAHWAVSYTHLTLPTKA